MRVVIRKKCYCRPLAPVRLTHTRLVSCVLKPSGYVARNSKLIANNEYKGCGRMWWWHHARHYLGICLELKRTVINHSQYKLLAGRNLSKDLPNTTRRFYMLEGDTRGETGSKMEVCDVTHCCFDKERRQKCVIIFIVTNSNVWREMRFFLFSNKQRPYYETINQTHYLNLRYVGTVSKHGMFCSSGSVYCEKSKPFREEFST